VRVRVFVALGIIQHAQGIRRVTFPCVPLYNIFPHYLIKTQFSKKKIYIYCTQNVYLDFLYNLCLQHFSF